MTIKYLNQNELPPGLSKSLLESHVVEEVIEPFLIQKNLVDRTPRGRVLTVSGWDYLDLPIPPNSYVYQEQKEWL